MTPEEAVGEIARALALMLSGAEWLRAIGPAAVAAAYNGIGPDWLPDAIRDQLSRWLSLYAICAVIHDCRYQYCNDGTSAAFDAANNELERNCRIVADATYSWFNPLRYLARRGGRLLANACRRFGWAAWRAAYDVYGSPEAKGETPCTV